MEDIKWQDPYKRRSVKKDTSWDERGFHSTPQNSFADKFLKNHGSGNQGSIGNSQRHSGYSDHYLGSGDKSNFVHGTQEPHYQYQQPYPQQPPVQQPYPQQPPVQQPYPQQPPVQPVYYQGPQPGYSQSTQSAHGPVFQNNGSSYSPAWRFLDLKSKKQTGDLYKKVLGYNKLSQSNSFCFSSSTAGEGVTTILANLVNYIKNQGTERSVIVIDANLDSSDQNEIFGLPVNSFGLKDVLDNRVDIQSALFPVAPGISVMGSGSPKEYRHGGIEPDQFLKVVNSCKQFADYVLIDCPPILSSSDAFSVAPAADITFLIVQAVKVRRQVAERGISALQNSECELGGIIMNRVQQVIPSWVYKYI